jgi:hypothetical protein
MGDLKSMNSTVWRSINPEHTLRDYAENTYGMLHLPYSEKYKVVVMTNAGHL